MKSNVVSVIMPAYNCESYIEQAILSVLNQTYQKIELIICDNQSTDHTMSIIKKYEDNEKIVIVTCSKKGVSYARNRAIKEATGSYIAFLDSDDLWRSDKLEKQIDFMNKNNISFCYSGYNYITETGEKIKDKSRAIKNVVTYQSLLKNNFIGTLTVVIDRRIVTNIQFKEIKHEDMNLWLFILKEHQKGMGISENLASYRMSRHSLSSNKLKAAKWRYNIYRKGEGFSIVKSIFYFTFYVINSISRKYD